MNRHELKRRRKRLRVKRILITIGIVMTMFLGYLGYTLFQTYQAASGTYNDMGRDKSKLREEAVTFLKDPVSILIMGEIGRAHV